MEHEINEKIDRPVDIIRLNQFLDLSIWVKKFLLIYLILLPFQMLPKFFGIEEGVIAKVIAYSDEINTIVMFFVVFTFIAIKPQRYMINLNLLPTKLFLLFFLTVFLSAFWNKVNVFQSIMGTYNMVKNIIVIYFFAILKWDEDDLRFLAKGVVSVAIILAITGIIGEVLALLGKDSFGLVITEEYKKRLGLYRVCSLLGQGASNYLAMYAILSFFLTDCAYKTALNRKIIKLIMLILIFLTFSKRGWISLPLTMFIARKQFKSIIPFYILIASMIVIFVLFNILDVTDVLDPEHYYRGFTYLKSFELFITHPILGVGPGMFGDIISVIFNSPYYSDWPEYFKDNIKEDGTIDSFWPIILVQTGIFGFIFFSAIFSYIYKIMQNSAIIFKFSNTAFYKLGQFLKAYIIALILLGLGSGLSKPYVVYTYFGLCGIYISMFLKYKTEKAMVKNA